MKLANFNAIRLIKFAFLLELISATIMLLAFIFNDVSMTSLLGPMIILCIGHPILAGTAISLAINNASNKSYGSSILNFTAMAVAMLITFLLGILHVTSPIILPSMFLLALSLMVIIYFSCKLRNTPST